MIGPHEPVPTEAATLPPGITLSLPAPTLIYNQPLDDAVQRLTDAGLVVREADIGCSNSTEPHFVRQVTVGPTKNVNVIVPIMA